MRPKQSASSEADDFYASLMQRRTRRTTPTASAQKRPLPQAFDLLEWEPEEWAEAVPRLPRKYRIAYGRAQQAEFALDPAQYGALSLDLLYVQDREELQEFIGRLTRKVRRGLASSVSDLGKTKFARSVGKGVRDVGRVANKVGKVASDVGKVLPLAQIVKLANQAPLGVLARMTYGAASAILRGQNVLNGALDGLGGSAIAGAVLKLGAAVIRGDNLIAAAKLAVKAGIQDAREALRFAAMVAPFVPGVGTGVGAALGAANALASGQPITQALIAGVRGAIPGGAIAQVAFDTATQLASGKRLDQVLLAAARNQLPPGPAQAAFDTAVALGQGKSLQDAALTGAGRLLPASPYTSDITSFAKRALAGQNLGQAALTTAGNAVLRRAQQQGGDLLGTAQGKLAGNIGIAANRLQSRVIISAPANTRAVSQPNTRAVAPPVAAQQTWGQLFANAPRTA